MQKKVETLGRLADSSVSSVVFDWYLHKISTTIYIYVYIRNYTVIKFRGGKKRLFWKRESRQNIYLQSYAWKTFGVCEVFSLITVKKGG